MINFRLNSIFSAALFISTCWGISGIYLFPLFIWVHIHAQWNNCSPVESRHTHRDHNSSYFLSGFFFFQGPSSCRHFTVDIAELCGDKEAEKNNNRPIDPHFTNFGDMGEIHLQAWSRPADWASIGFSIREQWKCSGRS